MTTLTETNQTKVNWKQVGLFIGLTFGFTFGLNLILQLGGGYGSTSTMIMLQLQMLLPAFFAMFLGMFVFKDSPYYFRKPMPDGRADRARGFFYLYMILTLFFVSLVVLSILVPDMTALVSQLSSIPILLGVIGLVLFRVFKGRESFDRANLRGGRIIDWIIYGGAIVVFLAIQTGLNALFRLGTPVDASLLAAQMGTNMSGTTMVIVLAVQMILVGSLMGLVIAFGEEYGWRGFLQSQLIRLGKKRGVLILGLIWGAWHYPVIWMGHNYPGQPVMGTLMMTIFCVLLAYVIGYAVLKTGSIWLAAFMHAIINQTASFFGGVIYAPTNQIFSFGIGLYGMATLAVIVFFLLRDPVWKDAPAQVVNTETITE
ncbi:MAG: hypothetical protein CVU43_07945 [Chloroflexi bacterium HGW-Chloroflexi-5]|jgi:membrane protease YdiL (CAAX protease family)|nr:MAG: hypothetical protein CVU43_07945 [Chloroflexi bacterium HGW-Chloroflexi-5]